jgi:hypothetical protein
LAARPPQRSLSKREPRNVVGVPGGPLGHDPRYKAALGAVGDMLPLAVRELKELRTDGRTPPGVRLKAIERVMVLNGLTEPQPQHSDRQELVRFLVEHKITLEHAAIPVPEEYLEGEYSEVKYQLLPE